MSESYALRPYQQKAFDQTVEGFKEVRRQIGVMSTGGGKTILFSKLANHYKPERTLILSHTNELCYQAWDKLYKSTGLIAGVEKAEHHADHQDQVVVSSIQTMTRRLADWPADHFGLVVCDEFHLAKSDTWSKVWNHFTGAKLLGVTATPFRSDNRDLSQMVDKEAFNVGLRDLIMDGYLSPIEIQTLPVNIDLSGVRSTQGDFDENEVALRLEPHLFELARLVKEHAGDRKCLWFWPLIKTSLMGREACKKAGLEAEHIDGQSEFRDTILRNFRDGRYHSLHNSNLLTTGYDESSIDCIVLTRPTRSRGLMMQMCGRGTRIHPGKKNLLLLDPLFLSDKFDLASPASLISDCPEKVAEMNRKARKLTKGSCDIFDIESQVEKDRHEALAKKMEDNKQRESKRFNPLNSVQKRPKFFDPSDVAYLLKNLTITDYQPSFSWELGELSQAQTSMLEGFKVEPSTVKTKGQASMMIGILKERRDKGLATLGHLKMLWKYCHPEPLKATFQEASQFMEKIVANGWRRL